MTRKKVLLGLVMMCALTGARSSAQTPTTQPGEPRLRFNSLERTDQKQVTDWMQAKMPNLAKLIAAMPDLPRRQYKKNLLLNTAAARWRTYEQAKDSRPTLENVMRSVRLEDDIFGYISQLEGASLDKRAELRDQIQIKTRALVDLFLSDRAERIAKLRARLDAEEKTLESDRAHANVLVDQRLQHFMIEPTTKPSDDADPATVPAQ